jgi:multiple sugar transport system substrate-binding protein
MSQNKRRILILLTAFILFSFASVNLFAKDPITLRVIWWGTQDRHDKTLKVIDLYQKNNPDVKIEPIYTGWTGYAEKLMTLAASNDLPDVIQITKQLIPQYMEKDLLEDLKRVKGIDLADMDRAGRDSGIFDGKLVGVSLGANAQCIVFNRGLFQKAGVGVPNEKWTWKDLERASSQINKKLGIYGVYNIAIDFNNLEMFARSRGESLYAKNLKSVGFKESTLTEFLEMALRMQKAGHMEPMKIAVESRSNEENSSYAKEKTAMRFLWSNKIVSVYKTLQKDSELTVLPGPKNNEGMFVNPSMFFSIPKASKNKEAAAKFISYFVNNIDANKILNSERGVPVVAKVRKSLVATLDPQNIKIFNYIAFLGKFSTRPMDTNFPSSDAENMKTLNSIFEEVMFEKITPKEGAKKLIKEFNSTLNK